MGLARNAEALGEPDLSVAGLQIWVHNQPNAKSKEPFDADWLTVTAHCGQAGATVWAAGEILTASGFERFGHELDQIHRQLEGKASLESHEPNLIVRIVASDGHGHIAMTVDITPDHMTQRHHFEFSLDQTFLRDVARQCEAILNRFPNPHAHRAI
jgi:hypothetical protein